MASDRDSDNWMKHLRLITPALVILFGIVGWFAQQDIVQVKNHIETIDSRLFVHLTNDEMHMPRSLSITKAEFVLYQQMRDKQMNDIKDLVYEIKKTIERK